MPGIQLSLTFYPWITQHVDPAEIKRNVIIFAETISESLTRIRGMESAIAVDDAISVPAQVDRIARGDCHVALMNPLGFAFARRRSPSVQVAAIALRNIDGKVGNTYFGQLYTKKQTAIAAGLNENALDWSLLAQRLKGRSIVFGSCQSTSNFLMPAFLLWQNGIHPFTTFKTATFAGGHETAAMAVYRGESDVGAGLDGVIVDLGRQYGYGDAEERLVRIARVSILSDPVAINVGDELLASQLQEAMLDAVSTSKGLAAFKIFWGNAEGLDKPPANAYQSLLEAVQALGLRESDVMS